MELKQLEYFVMVCEELHFTRAAEKLHISQPSLSQQIRLLEHEVGMPLFDRIGKKTMMTEAGSILLKHCYQLFHELKQARASIGALQGLTRGTLNIGALHSVLHDRMPSAVLAFHAEYPQIELSLSGLSHDEIIHKLLQNELDFGIIFLTDAHEELEITPLYEERLALAVPLNHPLACSGSGEIKLRQLHNLPMVALQDKYYLGKYMDALYREHSIQPQNIAALNTMSSILSMVARGAGAAILPSAYLDSANLELIRVLPVTEPSLTVQIGMAYRRNKYLCAASRVFMEQMKRSAQHRSCSKE